MQSVQVYASWPDLELSQRLETSGVSKRPIYGESWEKQMENGKPHL